MVEESDADLTVGLSIRFVLRECEFDSNPRCRFLRKRNSFYGRRSPTSDLKLRQFTHLLCIASAPSSMLAME